MIILGVVAASFSRSQVNEANPAQAGNRFFAGISYSFQSADLELWSMSLHSVWYGEDLGTHELSDREIDEINAVIDRDIVIHSINLEAGMSFLNNPDSKWHFNGKIFFGLSGSKSEIRNTVTDTMEYSFDSEFSKPCSGVGFDVGYSFNPHWGVSLRPYFMGTIGKITNIEDNINIKPENVTEVRQDHYFVLYEHLSLMADFTAGHFTLSAGPGIYWVTSRHKYSIDRVNDLNGDTMFDEITSHAISKSMIDGSIAVEWRIIDPLTFYATAGIAKDLFVNTGIHYNF